MKTVVRYGIILGVLVELWTVVMIATGWYKDPALLMLFFLVIPLQITILVVALRETAAAGAVYGKQVLNGIGISVIAGVIVFFGSAFLTTVVFPNYFAELKEMGAEMLAKAGRPAEEIESQMRVNAAMYDPWMNALQGLIGTVVTGAIVTAIAGAFVRKR
jgi:hypothetical protein